MKKRYFALLVVLAMMVGLLAGCGSSSSSSSSTTTTADDNTTAASSVEEEAAAEEPAAEEPAAEETQDEAAPAEDEAPAEEEEVVMGPEAYYASEETTEITLLFQYAAFFQGFFPNGWASSDWWTEFGEKTNTVWSLREISNLEWTENVNLLCAANDLPDVVCNLGNSYTGGYAAAIRDEMIYDVSDMLEEYAPNYYELLIQDEYTLRTCLTDDSEMGAVYALAIDPDPYTDGLWIRKDWLDNLGMDIPTTPEEMKEVLIAFRDNYGADVGLYQMVTVNNNRAAFEVTGVWNAFGPCNYYLDDDNKIQFGPMQDWFYEYCDFLKDLNSEGLFLTSDMTDKSSSELFAANAIGIEGDSPDNRDAYISLLDPEEQAVIELVPMAALGEPTEYGSSKNYTGTDSSGGPVSISTNCDNPEIVLKALNYLFTDEGSIFYTWGTKDVTYTVADDGTISFTDLVINNPDGVPFRAASGYYCSPAIPGLVDTTRSHSSWDDTLRSASGIWSSAYTGSSKTADVASLSLTDTENDSISVYLSDMNTYVTEWMNNVIFGDIEVNDANIQEFRDTLVNTMHVNDILDVYNGAYERFLSRTLK